MRLITLSKSLFISAALASAASCAAEDPGDASCDGDTCDAKTPLKVACSKVLADRSGRGFLPETLKDDPLIKLVYSDEAGGCPITAVDIIKLLNEKETTCDDGADGLASRAISEQAQLSNKVAGSEYRVVTNKTCSGRESFGMLFSMFGFGDPDEPGMQVKGKDLPSEGIEIITFDKSDGVFNYYKEVGGKMGFFGTSLDFVTQGPGGPDLTSIRGCGNCHTGGGLIMKELNAPWLHWEGSTTTPGVAELISNRAEFMGRQSDGIALEGIVRSGNDAWNKTRIKFMKANGTVADLLRPLFCPVELNIAEGDESSVPSPFLADQTLAFPFVDLPAGDYDKLLGAIGANVPGTTKKDTFFQFPHFERSGADDAYVAALVGARILDQKFVDDVLAVDFTRSVFSNDRCNLLAKAPKLAPADRTSKNMRDAWIKSLKGSAPDSPAGVLLAHFEASAKNKPIDHGAIADAFGSVCQTRAQATKISVGGVTVNPFLVDVLKVRSLQRKMVFGEDGEIDTLKGSAQHPFKLLEFDDTMPTDNIIPSRTAKADDPMAVHIDARLDPNTCELVNKFVVAKPPVPEPAN